MTVMPSAGLEGLQLTVTATLSPTRLCVTVTSIAVGISPREVLVLAFGLLSIRGW